MSSSMNKSHSGAQEQVSIDAEFSRFNHGAMRQIWSSESRLIRGMYDSGMIILGGKIAVIDESVYK